jgi:hypothetical protein
VVRLPSSGLLARRAGSVSGWCVVRRVVGQLTLKGLDGLLLLIGEDVLVRVLREAGRGVAQAF